MLIYFLEKMIKKTLGKYLFTTISTKKDLMLKKKSKEKLKSQL